jgi:cell division protein FtsQ
VSASSRRRLLVVVVVLLVLATGAWMATRSPLLDVDHLVVRGNERVTTPEILRAAGLERGDPLVWLDVGEATGAVEALPWVRDARVEREWPDTVRVTVRERRAVAWADTGDGRAYLIDPHARVLAVEPAPPAGLPQLLDVATTGPVGGTITPVEGARVAGLLHGLVQAGTRTIATDGGRVTLQTASGQEIRLGRPTQLRVKVRAAVAVLGAPQALGKAYVDVSAPSNPVAG